MIQIKKDSMPYKINAILLHVISLPKEREKTAKFSIFYLEIFDPLLPWWLQPILHLDGLS